MRFPISSSLRKSLYGIAKEHQGNQMLYEIIEVMVPPPSNQRPTRVVLLSTEISNVQTCSCVVTLHLLTGGQREFDTLQRPTRKLYHLFGRLFICGHTVHKDRMLPLLSQSLSSEVGCLIKCLQKKKSSESSQRSKTKSSDRSLFCCKSFESDIFLQVRDAQFEAA